MASINLVNSSQLSSILRESLGWNENVSSVMVSAINGSIMASAFRHGSPSVKAMRTRSTTVVTAYTIAGQQTLVFEAQRTGALTVVTSLADEVVLCVTGPEPHDIDAYEKTVHEAADREDEDDFEDDERSEENEKLRVELEAVNQELAVLLRQELSSMKWPDDI